MRSPKLYFVDLRLFVLLLAWVFWPRWWTLAPVVCVMGFLVVVGHKGYRPGAAVRAVRRRLAGRPRAWVSRRYGRWVDYGAWGAVAVVVAVSVSAPAGAEFLYIAPMREEPPTLAVTGAVPDGDRIAMPPVTGEADGEEGSRPVAMAQIPAQGVDDARAGHRPRVVVRVRGGRSTAGGGAPAAVSGETTVGGGEGGGPTQGGTAGEGELALAAAAQASESAPEAPAVWEVAGGSTLAQVLGEWGKQAEVEVVMLTDRTYEIASSHRFTGAFEEAVRALLFGLGDLAYAPIGQMTQDGRVLAIHHRAPKRSGEEEE